MLNALPPSHLGHGCLCVCQDRTIIATAIPKITDEFHSLNDIGWYVYTIASILDDCLPRPLLTRQSSNHRYGSAFMLATCGFQLLLGRVYTFYSPKYVFMLMILVFVRASTNEFPALLILTFFVFPGAWLGSLWIGSQFDRRHHRPRYPGRRIRWYSFGRDHLDGQYHSACSPAEIHGLLRRDVWGGFRYRSVGW